MGLGDIGQRAAVAVFHDKEERGWEVEIVNVVPVVPHLAVVEVAQGIAHRPGGVGDEVAFGRIEKPRRMGEGLLGGQLDLGMWQSRDVVELPGDLHREGLEMVRDTGFEPVTPSVSGRCSTTELTARFRFFRGAGR